MLQNELSPHAAMIEAGFRTRTFVMPRNANPLSTARKPHPARTHALNRRDLKAADKWIERAVVREMSRRSA